MAVEPLHVKAPAIYARVSSEDQVSGTSLDDQVDKCLKQASVYGWHVSTERVYIDDGYSGSTLERPAIERLRAAIRSGDVDCVMVYKLDRLSRNIRDTVNLVLEEWSKTFKVVFRSVTEDFNTNSPLGTLIFSILASFAHFERDVIRDRTASGRQRRFAQGRRAVGDPPFGYIRGEVNGTMVVHPEQAEVVRKIFRLYLQGLGFMKIATLLNDSGYRTSKGHLWTDKTVRDILLNEVYTGKVKYSGEYAPGVHLPIVDAELFQAAQEVREAREKVGGRSLGTEFLLAGITRCKGCGQLMYTQPGTESRRRRKDGTSYITQNHAYYLCGGRIKKGGRFCRCGNIQRDVLEVHVIERMRSRFGGQVAEVQSIQGLQNEMNANLQELKNTLVQLDVTIREREQAVERWETAFERGELNAERFGARVQRLEQEIAGLHEQKAEVAEKLEAMEKKQINVDWIRRVSRQLDSWDALPAEVRKQLIHYLIDHIRVWKTSLGRGQHKEDTEIEVDIVWNRSERALPEEDLDGTDLRQEAGTASAS